MANASRYKTYKIPSIFKIKKLIGDQKGRKPCKKILSVHRRDQREKMSKLGAKKASS